MSRECGEFDGVNVRPIDVYAAEDGIHIREIVSSDTKGKAKEYAEHLRDDHGRNLKIIDPDLIGVDPGQMRGSDKIWSVLDSGKWTAAWEPSGSKIKPGYQNVPGPKNAHLN